MRNLEDAASEEAHRFLNWMEQAHGFIPYGFHKSVKTLLIRFSESQSIQEVKPGASAVADGKQREVVQEPSAQILTQAGRIGDTCNRPPGEVTQTVTRGDEEVPSDKLCEWCTCEKCWAARAAVRPPNVTRPATCEHAVDPPKADPRTDDKYFCNKCGVQVTGTLIHKFVEGSSDVTKETK